MNPQGGSISYVLGEAWCERATKSQAAEGQSGKRNWKPVANSRPGTTRRLFRTSADSVRISHVPISMSHSGLGNPKRMPHAWRRDRIKSPLGSGWGEARL